MKRLPPWVRNLAGNLLWLAGALLLAVFVWIAATTMEDPVESRSFPQRVPIDILTDDGMIVTNDPVSSIQIVLRARSGVWDTLATSDILVTADLTGYAPGTHTVDLDIDFTSVNRIVVEDFQPRQITVVLDQAAERLVPIDAEIRSEPPTGFEIADIGFDKQEARVTGPATQVDQVTSATIRLILEGERNAFTRNYRLFALDDEGRVVPDVEIEPEMIDVSVDIEPREDFREVFVTPNIIGEPASGYVIYSITYEPQTVLVSGRPSDLEQITGTLPTLPIDLTGQTRSFQRTVTVELPPGVFLATSQSVTVSVEIDTLTASRRFERLPVQVQGLDSTGSLQATITPTEVTILITGPQPILDTLTPDSISVRADLTGLTTGGHQIPLQAVVNREGLESAVISVLPPVLDVQITATTPLPPTATRSPNQGQIIIPPDSITPPPS
ncbi:MAG: hypothetical protein JXN59_10420 [Anaerolineae bacterium]|nr:hypothetical protein [Anaerolineae bacterium]